MNMGDYALGIDIGTTSVKVCVLNLKDNAVLAERSKDTLANVPSDLGIDGNKQDVPKILSTINICVAKLPKELLRQVKRIGVCGQMHGVMFWSHEPENAWRKEEHDGHFVRFEVKPDQVSNVYTWQDNRCSEEFLMGLPKPDSHLQIHTGFGIPTMFWMLQNRAEEIAKYERAGTIQDFTVSMLCDTHKHYISEQNAASWGYFDCRSYTWNLELLESVAFPVNMLPEIKMSGEIVGYLADTWHAVPGGTPIGVAMGDLQCSVLSTIEESSDAVLNISTSAQIAYVVERKLGDGELSGPPSRKPMTFLPYFNKRFLAVAASLNGGNSLATFVKMLQQWLLDLTNTSTPQERHKPELTASVTNINGGNLRLGQVFRALCEGMIRNLLSMMPKDVLDEANVKRIVCSGSGITNNETLQNAVREMYGYAFKLASASDAAKGAAMAMKPTEIQ